MNSVVGWINSTVRALALHAAYLCSSHKLPQALPGEIPLSLAEYDPKNELTKQKY